MSANNVMLDLETLDVLPTAVVVSIGAVRFSKTGLQDEYYAVLNAKHQTTKGRTIGAETVRWWVQQSDAARAVFTGAGADPFAVLQDFSSWVMQGESDVFMWGNGADFDCVILGSLYDSYGMKKPWSYSNNRCYRTLKNICEAEGSHSMPGREGTHHNALDDARYQALMARRYLNGRLR